MKQKRWLGVLGGSGFLLLIKGVGGLLANIWNRPSSSWRTVITLGDVLTYLILVCALYALISRVTSSDTIDKKRLLLLGGAALIVVSLIFAVPAFRVPLFSLHPMILVVGGALLLPAMGNLSFHA